MCIVTGDLFHSAVGDEVKDLYELVSSHSSVQFILTSGNHDPHLSDYPPNFNVSERYELGPFSFSHEPISNTEYYQFTGHLHPILKMNGKARNRVSLKAFWVRTNQCILPAFGYTTYGKTIQPGPEDLLLGAAPDQIIALNHSDFTRIQR
jgi:metallophosphoesterase superfamily enzyme